MVSSNQPQNVLEQKWFASSKSEGIDDSAGFMSLKISNMLLPKVYYIKIH